MQNPIHGFKKPAGKGEINSIGLKVKMTFLDKK